MSFYSSQVGKKASRYCNSSLYGTNLSSVYADDGPPPLDDSTQDEDDDEMVFRDPSPSSIKVQKDREENEEGKSTQSVSQQSSSNNDFGDFSTFADFSSAFGSTNESSTNEPSWFNSNGNCNQSAGTFKSSETGLKSKDFSNSDDEFGCFSGGDDSDFEDFKGFPVNQSKNGKGKNESEISVNGLEAVNLVKGLSDQHGLNENAIRSDFFSDDEDEFDDFPSSNQIAANDNSSSCAQQISSNDTQNIPNSIETREMPSIFSDDDDFGEFGSSSCGNNASSNTPEILKDEALHIDTKDFTSKDIGSSHLINTNSDSNISTFTTKQEVTIQQQNNDDKGIFALQKSDIKSESESMSRESEQSRQQNHHVSVDDSRDTESKTKGLLESSVSECQPEVDIVKISSLPNQSSSLNHAKLNVCNDSDDDDGFGDFTTLTDSQSMDSQSNNTKREEVGDDVVFGKEPKDDDDDGFESFAAFSDSQSMDSQSKSTKHDDVVNDVGFGKEPKDDDDGFESFAAFSDSQSMDSQSKSTKHDDVVNDVGFGKEPKDDDDGFESFAAFSDSQSMDSQSKSTKHDDVVNDVGFGKEPKDDDDGFESFAAFSDSQSMDSQSKSTKHDDVVNDVGFGKEPKDDDDGFESFAAFSDSQSRCSNVNEEVSNFSSPNKISDGDDDFGDFSTGLQSKNTEDDDGSFDKLQVKSSISLKDDDDDFEEFSTFSESNTRKNISEEDSFGKFEHDDGDFGDSSSAPKSNTQKNTNDDDADFGDFATNLSTNDQQIKDSNDTLRKVAENSTKNQDDDFGDFSVSSNTQSSDKTSSLSNKTLEDDANDDFGSFSTPSQTGVENTADNGDDKFGDFAKVSSTEPPASIDDDDDDDFGDFGTFSASSKTETSPYNNDNIGQFATLTQSHGTNHTESDDDFGDFATISTTSKTKDNHNNDNLEQFATFPQSHDRKPTDNIDDDFGEISSNKSQDDDDEFSGFSSTSQPTISKSQPSNKEFSNFKSSSESDFASFSTASKTSDDFGDFSSTSSQRYQPTVQSSTPSATNWSKSTIQSKENQGTSSQSKTEMATIFKPQKNTSVSRISNTFKQSFVGTELSVQRNMIVVMLQNEVEAGNASIWQRVNSSEKDGSLRFEWVTSDHQLNMLEAVSMFPVRIQTSASFKSSGPVQTPLFASGLGLLEPVKGVITPFHHGVEEINPSQDPFGAPPEVGVPDLGFGGSAGKKDTQTGHLEVKDNMDTISVSSSLDLDFLAPASGNGDSTKTESRGLYEDDLLGLGMQFSATNDSPKVFSHQKKLFEFNTSTVPLPNSDKNLSESAKKIVNNFEELSFMLSKVLMFPLKS